MAIDIKFDLAGNPEPPTIILATRNGNKLGQLEINPEDIELTDKLSDVSEFTFILNKHVNNRLTNLWDKVVDFKLVYCKEWDMWFEIRVELDEATETVKTVFCTQLGQAELSQIMLFDVEINTEKDIKRDDYKTSILYDKNNPKASILNRLLEKAPHYSIEHVDFTIANIQRSFSFDDTSICDAFGKIAEEIGCLFVYNSNSSEDGKIKRTISVYDLQQKCLNLDCGHRGEFTDVCPKCGGTDIKYGYGEDTTIFVTSDDLASEGIQLTTDTDSVKNCFKLEAGDDLMTATIRNCNPNGTDYIWYFSDSVKEDMSDELVERLESYDELYRYYYEEHESHLNADLVNEYNALVEKYKDYYNTKSSCLNCRYEGFFENSCPSCNSTNILSGKMLHPISNTIKGYSTLMNAYYDVIDLGLYLESALMPTVEMSGTSAKEQAESLVASFPPAIAVNSKNIESVTGTTADSAALSMAKVIVKSTYKVEIDSSTYNENTHVWTGNFSIINYSDDTDKYPKLDTDSKVTVTVNVNNDEETFIKQKIEKTLNKDNTDDYSVVGLFKREYDDFCAELKKYALIPLKGFYDSCDACIGILIDNGVGNTEEKKDLYEKLYVPYHDKSSAISNEIKIREKEVAMISGIWDKTTDEKNPKLITKGLQQYIEECKNEIQSALDFESYLGEKLLIDFCAYRRECKYSNENYISDGLDNAQLFVKASEFIDAAENEIYKSAELQHSISTTLNNLLAIPKFKPLIKYFKTGNWIRVRIDDQIYKLRLLEYTISYGNLDKINVEFSDVIKIKNSFSDIESILSKASSIASSYDYVQKQAEQGNEALDTIDEWLSAGLNTALVQIQNNDSEDIVINKNGILGRSYNELTDTYSPEQLRITHNILAYTDDDWKSVRQAIGKHGYVTYDSQSDSWYQSIGYGMSADFVTAGQVMGSRIVGGEIYSSNYHRGTSGSTTDKPQGTYMNLATGEFKFGGEKLVYKNDTLTLRDVTIEWANTNAPEVTVTDVSGLDEYLEQIGNLEDQLDSRAQTWYQASDPSVDWTTAELKALHEGDLWHYTGETAVVNGVNRIKNSEWVWQKVNGSYQWAEIEISDDVFDAIDGKAQIFVKQPVPPYDIGDLWVEGSSGDIKHCVKARAEGESFYASDWAKSSKYTDDEQAKLALEQAKKGIEDAANGIELAKAAQASAQSAETNAKTYADGLANGLKDAYEKYADSKIREFDANAAKYLGANGGTLLGTNYIISPLIAGGYLNITATDDNSRVLIDPNNLTGNNYIFQVHNGKEVTVGIDKSGNAQFTGNIYATSLTLGNNVSIPTDKISGMDKYAKTENIPTSVTQLTGGNNIVYTDNVSISSSTSSDGTTKQSITVGNKTYTSIIDGDFIFTDIGLGTNTDDASKRYTCISSDGLLTAKNALIYGTIFATNGEIGGCSISEGRLCIDDAKINDNLLVGDTNSTYVKITSGGTLECYGGSIKGSNIFVGDKDKNGNYVEITSGGILTSKGGLIYSPTIYGDSIQTFGTFEVWSDEANAVTGYMGYGKGMDASGNNTYGVVLSNHKDLTDSSNYIIVTNGGVRLQAGDNKLVATQSGIFINGYNLLSLIP